MQCSKPDVQIKHIFKGIGICSSAASFYEAFRAVDRVAHNVEVNPYKVDKLFWLVGSGHFYDDPPESGSSAPARSLSNVDFPAPNSRRGVQGVGRGVIPSL